jgi:protein required for attachment to host cells
MCVVVADSARARLFTYRAPDRAETSSDVLLESEDLVSPSRRRRDSETFRDSRPGLRQAQRGGPRHGVDDRRAASRDEEERIFAGDIVEHATQLCERLGRCPLVIVASRGMLNALGGAMAHAPAWLRERATHELARDLTHLRPAQVHDWLAAESVLPPRRRAGL